MKKPRRQRSGKGQPGASPATKRRRRAERRATRRELALATAFQGPGLAELLGAAALAFNRWRPPAALARTVWDLPETATTAPEPQPPTTVPPRRPKPGTNDV